MLKGKDNWFKQIEIIKTVAKKSNIWEYINPNIKDSKLIKLEPLVKPKVKDIY